MGIDKANINDVAIGKSLSNNRHGNRSNWIHLKHNNPLRQARRKNAQPTKPTLYLLQYCALARIVHKLSLAQDFSKLG